MKGFWGETLASEVFIARVGRRRAFLVLTLKGPVTYDLFEWKFGRFEVGVLQYLCDGGTFCWVNSEDVFDEVYFLVIWISLYLTEFLSKKYWSFHLGEDLLGGLAPKWSYTRHHLKEEDAHRPYVDRIVIGRAQNHFRCHILIRATQRLALS